MAALLGAAGTFVSPGECVSLSDRSNALVVQARHYLENRPGCGIDPDRAEAEYGLKVCVSGNPEIKYGRVLVGRIICPCWMHGRLVGWQARSTLLNPAEDTGIAAVRYLSMPGPLWRQSTLFGYDHAEKSNVVCLVEGPLDVVQAGPPCVCAMGMAVSRPQLEMVATRWGGVGHAIFVVFDGEPAAHVEQDKAAAYLKRASSGARVFSPKLRSGDPGSTARSAFWEFVLGCASGGDCEVLGDVTSEMRQKTDPAGTFVSSGR